MDMNKPVAWIIDEKMTDCDDNFIWNTGDYPDWQVEDWIPLYTRPVKELTDEEIEDVRSEEWFNFAVKQKSNGIEPLTGAAWEHWLAKAILRKAQENG